MLVVEPAYRAGRPEYPPSVHAAALLLSLWAVDAGAPDAARSPDARPPNRGEVARQWQALRTPAGGPARAIGTCSCGCLRGAATLAPSGRGYEVLRLGRHRRYGHPTLVAFIERLGAAAAKAKLGLVVVGDLSQPRGGPTPSGHRSHQTGLDADVGYVAPAGARARMPARAREHLSPPAVVDATTHEKTPSWTPNALKIVALAAADPDVDRIFVDPGIKKLLCASELAKEPWQGRLRPWWRHHDHFHVRLRCPSDSPDCVPQEPIADDGCGKSLAWWFSAYAEATREKKKEDAVAAGEPVLPAACADVMGSAP
jgi:penicillin-insensitive murein endopeptidase